MRLLYPSDAEPFKRFDRVGGVILHPLEDDDAVAVLASDLGLHHVEEVAEPVRLDLCLDQTFRAVLQRALYLTDADDAKVRVPDALLDGEPCEKMRATTSAATSSAFVSGGL